MPNKHPNQHLWIGGSPCSGKSSLAKRLGVAYNLPVYHADAFFEEHTARAKPGSVLARIGSASPEKIFMRSAEAMLADFVALAYEEFPMILADLERQPWRSGAIVEGCALLPELIGQLSEAKHVLYLVPTEAFQRLHYAQRPWIHAILNQTSDPASAWENWRLRDALYSNVVEAQAERRGFNVIKIDGSLTQNEVCNFAFAQLEGWVNAFNG